MVGFYAVGSPATVQSQLRLGLQSGAGAFAIAGTYSLPVAGSAAAAGDVNGDELDDLVVLGGVNECTGLLQSTLLSGSFAPAVPLR